MNNIKRSYNLRYLLGILYWEETVKDKENSKKYASQIKGDLIEEHSNLVTSGVLLEEAKEANLSARTIQVLEKSLNIYRKIPTEFLKEMDRLQVEATAAWIKARKENDYQIFVPHLKKMIEMKKKRAAYLDDSKDPYDVLLDEYEEGFAQEQYDVLFNKISEKLVPLIKKVVDTKIKRERILNDQFLDKQKEFTQEIIKLMEFDLTRGEVAEYFHPFCSGINRNDVRFTTRYSDDVFSNMKSVFHELGHARYEQNFSEELDYTFLDSASGLAMHESQSRLYENNIASSREFWNKFGELFKSYFPFYSEYSNEELYQLSNNVELSEIRVEADELTYPLHILLRYEIEKGLIDGSVPVETANEKWNELYEKYFGVSVSSDANGILQDVHWSSGLFGYFPTYLLGSAISAQLMNQMQKECNPYEFENDSLTVIHDWLRKSIHEKGRTKTTNEIIKEVTSEEFNVDYYIEYLTKKYSDLYNL